MEKSGLFTVNWLNIKSALMFGLLIAIVAIITHIVSVGNIFALDWKAVTNIAVLAFLGSFMSTLKAFLTTDEGKFLGVQVR